MFTRVQAEGYRSLRYIDQRLGPFHALVGPNASGKTTILEVIDLVGDVIRLRGDVPAAIDARTADFEKLVWLGLGRSFKVAVEASIPIEVLERVDEEFRGLTRVRYELEISLDPASNELGLDHETLWMIPPADSRSSQQRTLFPQAGRGTAQLFVKKGPGRKVILKKQTNGNDTYYPEGKRTYVPVFRSGRQRAALGNVPADDDSFPVSAWFQTLLQTGISNIQLDGVAISAPSKPGLGSGFLTDGSNLPWVVDQLARNPERFSLWLEHVRTALTDVVAIDTVVRAEDRHRYLVVEYANGAKVPSWLVSDGSLRLMALTLLAYIEAGDSVYLIEEPENGINPRAIETVIQSLSSLYGRQVLMATHSPVALNMLEPHDVLCVAKDEDGATDIVSGDDHPALLDWRRGRPDLGTLFASGILG